MRSLGGNERVLRGNESSLEVIDKDEKILQKREEGGLSKNYITTVGSSG